MLVKENHFMQTATENNPQIDEAIWQAWLNKNEAQDKFRLARRLRVMGVVALFLMSALLWRFTG